MPDFSEIASFLKTPEGMGLLSGVAGYAAGARRGTPVNNIGRGLLSGVTGYAQAEDQQMQKAQADQMGKLRGMQIDQMNRQLELNKRLGEALKGGAVQSLVDNVPASLAGGGGPTIGNAAILSGMNAATPVAKTASVSPAQALADAARAAGDYESYQKAQALLLEEKKLAPKYKQDFVQAINPETNKLENAMVADDGTYKFISAGVKPSIKTLNLNDRTVAYDENTVAPGTSWRMGMTPDGAASNSLGRDRLSFDRQQAAAPTYHDGAWVSKPTAQNPEGTIVRTPLYVPKAGTPEAMAASSKRMLPMLEEANTLLDNSTQSWGGTIQDFVQSVGGKTNEGAKNAAKLKALEGQIMLAQPRMEGPQSDKDVALYRQMAGLVGDSTVPAETRRAALNTVYKLHQRYSGLEETGLPALVKPIDIRSSADAIIANTTRGR